MSMNQMAHPGLTTDEVRERQRQGRVNRVRGRVAREYGDIVVRNVATWFNALVVPAAVALHHLGEYRGAVAVSGMMCVNTVLGLAQEIAAKRRLDRLTLVAATRVRVVRDGAVSGIAVDEVVEDDVLQLAVGELIVADGPVLESRFLEVDEALLTGEADPVPRHPGDRLLAGSYCVAGEGLYRAEQVGVHATAQEIARQARHYRHAAGPIQQCIDQVVRLLSYTAIVLSLAYVGLFLLDLLSEEDLAQMVAATVTSMVPQGLVLTATLAFTLGAIRLALRGAVAQRLDAVEAMAAVDVLCLDKTGTLTTNRLSLERLLVVAKDVSEEEVRQRLRLFVSAAVDRTSKNLEALRTALGETAVEKLDELPFKAQNRFSAVRLRDGEQERVLFLGACEALRERLGPAPPCDWESAWKELLPTGLRLLLFAESSTPEHGEGLASIEALRPLALIALRDELRPEAVAVLERLSAQDVALKLLSGDNPHTVRATLAGLRLSLGDESVISGEQLAEAGDPDEMIRRHSVFGRVTPQQKMQVIVALQRMGHFVAMLGDGVNDVLPIKRADLGVAMGEGSTAAKTVAGLVLQNNDFRLLPAALDEARIIVCNLRRAGKLFLTKNVYTLFLIACAGVFSGLTFPYLPQQVTLLNALTIGLPALVITLSRTPSGATDRKRFLREVGSFALRTGIEMGVAGLVVLLISAWGRGDDESMQRTLLLAVLILLGFRALFRAHREGGFSERLQDRLIFGLIALGACAWVVVLYWRLAADFFELTRLGSADWMLVLAVVATAVVGEQGLSYLTSVNRRATARTPSG
jgi:cation-transporting ATPase E